MKVVELGCPGHFCAVSSCSWTRHTQIGTVYRVSSVGEYRPNRGEREMVGCDRYFETMVFATTPTPLAKGEGCGCLTVEDYGAELDMEGYATAGEAQEGHERMVAKWLARENKP